MRLVVLAVALLAGCATVETQDDVRLDERLPEEVTSTFNGTFDMLVNPDPEVIGFGGASLNCIFFWDTDGATYSHLNGTATLTWDALPNTMTFRLRTTGADENVATGAGASPVVLEIQDLQPDNWGVGFWVDYSVTDGTVPIAQEAQLAIDFTHEGDLPAPRQGTCAGGGP